MKLATRGTISPNIAHEVRLTAKGVPNGCMFFIDERGLLQFTVSADGKT